MNTKFQHQETWVQPGRGAFAGDTLRLSSVLVDGYAARIRYVVERQERDALGGERWSEVASFTNDGDDTALNLMMGLFFRIKEAKR